MLSDADQDLRGLLTRLIAERGHAPTNEELAARALCTVRDIEAGLRRLHEAHALLLHPDSARPWVVHPFALSPSLCWVETAERGYWASCLYCGFGIAAALGRDATLSARFGGEAEPAVYRVRGGVLEATTDVFHLATPAARWWDNVVHACASFQPFRCEADADAWCIRHALPKGAVMSLPALHSFASDWYGGYLRSPWRKRPPAEARALLARHGLTGPFWQLGADR